MILTLRSMALSKTSMWLFMTAGLRFLRFTFRILLLWPAVGVALLAAGVLLVVQINQPEGKGGLHVLEKTIAVGINELLIVASDPEVAPASEIARSVVDSLKKSWLLLVILSVVLEVLCWFAGLTSSRNERYAVACYRTGSGASGVIIDGRFYHRQESNDRMEEPQ
ncbi:hypothetical protein [Klebsiella oxytoca]|uniref:hypothetical protein n=1 Tax=Klebsiella oxytoca TaxID=571 RepID=UPI0039C8F44B